MIDFDPNAKLTGESMTLEQLMREYKGAINKEVYIQSRFEEWLKLRKIFEQDVSTLKAELQRVGAASDKFILEKLQEQLRIRDQWWSVALQKVSGVELDVQQYKEVNPQTHLEKLAKDFVETIITNLEKVREYRKEQGYV